MIEFLPADPTVPPALDLLAAMLAEMYDLYGNIDGPAGRPWTWPNCRPDRYLPGRLA